MEDLGCKEGGSGLEGGGDLPSARDGGGLMDPGKGWGWAKKGKGVGGEEEK